MIIEIERASGDGISHQYWRFSTHNFPHACLTGYGVRTCKTKRHKPVVTSKWDTYSERESTLKRPSSIPDEVIEEFYARLFAMVRGCNLYIGARAEESNIYKKGE